MAEVIENYEKCARCHKYLDIDLDRHRLASGELEHVPLFKETENGLLKVYCDGTEELIDCGTRPDVMKTLIDKGVLIQSKKVALEKIDAVIEVFKTYKPLINNVQTLEEYHEVVGQLDGKLTIVNEEEVTE